MADGAKGKWTGRLVAGPVLIGHELPRNCGEALRAGCAAEGANWRAASRKPSRYRPAMQMGPALLPTPLSPACGHPVPCETSGGPSASLVSGHTWRPMSGSVRPILRLVSCDWRIRVSSPALAPASGFRSCPAAFPEARSLRFQLPCAGAWPRPCSFADQSCCGLGAFAFPLHSRPARVPGLSGVTASRPSQTSPLAFGRGLLHAVSR
jgi:hypothetical protein